MWKTVLTEEMWRKLIYWRNIYFLQTTFELVNSVKPRDLKHEFGANLCDGRWHNTSVHLSAHDITLTIDEVSFASSRIITKNEGFDFSGCSNDYNVCPE